MTGPSSATSSTKKEKMDPSFIPYRLAGAYLRQQIEATQGRVRMPLVGIICGSGLSGLSSTLHNTLTVSYADIPGFPSHCTVAGHHGEVVFGELKRNSTDDSPGGVPTICFRGRFHSYEGHDMKTVVLPVYVMRVLGVQICIVTNAAGGLNPSYSVGTVVAVSDHLALPMLTGNNPLIGPNDSELGPRFPATSNAYPERLRRIAQQAATTLGYADFFVLHGTYAFVSGPQYESKAECRFLRSLGGDAVGMSTVPEIVAAHHCNMQTLCLSLITNKVVMEGDEGSPIATHDEVLQAVAQRSEQMQALVQEIVAMIHSERILHALPSQKQLSTIEDDDDDEEEDVNEETKFEHDENAKVEEQNLLAYQAGRKEALQQVVLGFALLSLGFVIGRKSSRNSE